jgi:hypothetical protein
MTSAMDEVIEGYAETTKDLVKKWRDYASGVARNLETGYSANRASADLGTAVSLAIETGARLSWEVFDAMAAISDAPNRPHRVESEEFFAPKGAKLTLKGDLTNRPGNTLAASRVTVIPSQLASEDSRFKLSADAAGCPAGVYRGTVLASTSGAPPEEVEVQIEAP